MRVANRENEEALVDFALRTTAAIVEERCRELRCGTEDSLAEANRAYLARSLTIRRDARRGMMTNTVELPMETGELVDAALDRARDDSNSVEFGDEPWAARQADALVAVARSYWSGQQSAPRGTADNYLVNVHVDHSALAGNDGRSALLVESVRRLCCDTDRVTVVNGDDGEPLSIGRKSRIVPAATRRALRARDKGCTDSRAQKQLLRRRAPYSTLGGRWRDAARQPAAPLLQPSPPRTRRRLSNRQGHPGSLDFQAARRDSRAGLWVSQSRPGGP